MKRTLFLALRFCQYQAKQNYGSKINVSAPVQFLTYYALTCLIYWILSGEPVL